MPAWATVLLTLGASAIAVFGTLAATRLQHRYAGREREDAATAAQTERGAAIAGPIETLLVDADPARLGINVSSETPERMRELGDRWVTLRDELATFAAGHPSSAIDTVSRQLMVAVSNALTSAAWLVRDLLERSARRPMLGVAQSDHGRARDLLGLFRRGIRGEVDEAWLEAQVAAVESARDAEHERARHGEEG